MSFEELWQKNPMLKPRIEKVVVNFGVGESGDRLTKGAQVIEELTGQKPIRTRAKQTNPSFGIRKKLPIGLKVTLRGKRMYNFLQKFISISSPRVKDFRGLPRNGFDGRANYNFGLNEQLMFPEVVFDNILKTHGMNITIVTTAADDKQAFRLLELVGIPFTKGK